jgi:hypothetical protein
MQKFRLTGALQPLPEGFMMRGFSGIKIVGILLLVAGVVVLGIGIYQFVEFRQSVGGRIAGGLTRAANQLTGSTKIPKGMVQPIIMMIGGALGAAAGFFITKKS